MSKKPAGQQTPLDRFKVLLKKSRDIVSEIDEIIQDVEGWDEKQIIKLKNDKKKGEQMLKKIIGKVKVQLETASQKMGKCERAIQNTIEHPPLEEEEFVIPINDEINNIGQVNELNQMEIPINEIPINEIPINEIQMNEIQMNGVNLNNIKETESYDHSLLNNLANSTNKESQSEGAKSPTPSIGENSIPDKHIYQDDNKAFSEAALSVASLDDILGREFEFDKEKQPLTMNEGQTNKNAITSSKSTTNLSDLDTFINYPTSITSPKSADHQPRNLSSTFATGGQFAKTECTSKSQPETLPQKQSKATNEFDEWDDLISGVGSIQQSPNHQNTINTNSKHDRLLDISDPSITPPSFQQSNKLKHPLSDDSISTDSMNSTAATSAAPPVQKPPIHLNSGSDDFSLDDFMKEPTLEEMLSTSNLKDKNKQKSSDFSSALDEYLGPSSTSQGSSDLMQFASKQEESRDHVLSFFSN